MSEDPVIEERENGPLVAKGIRRMVGPDGAEIEIKEVMALCRCGRSEMKPFCDGSHKEAGFESRGGEPAGPDKLLTYEGAEVTVTYNPLLCSHAAECGRLASHIFNPEQKPWVQPDKGAVAEVEAVITACPSGALALKRPDGAREHRLAERCDVTIEKNGPYWVQNVKSPVGAQGQGMSSKKYVLCRCGLSGNKPYCDGTHRDAGWQDD
ncbi:MULTISPECIES: CDGSH iron-sulfur domain-containing protein [unclassified Roseovarius]|uniref:CDGSH iron-sulfur domain-containing protein n=1 Tax=unclassified Roseovarius TaxID=2614913 RepID=UPI00273E167D|nr:MULTISPECIES: CDGSH iron-sulfur domain-containing protein [unclassified Roseovarius]